MLEQPSQPPYPATTGVADNLRAVSVEISNASKDANPESHSVKPSRHPVVIRQGTKTIPKKLGAEVQILSPQPLFYLLYPDFSRNLRCADVHVSVQILPARVGWARQFVGKILWETCRRSSGKYKNLVVDFSLLSYTIPNIIAR